MKKDKLLLRVLYVVVGIIILCAGAGMSIKTGIGTDSCDCFYDGMSQLTGISVGSITFIGSAILFVGTLIIDKSKLGITTLIQVFLCKYPVDFFYNIYTCPSDNIIIKCLLCVFFIALMCLGAIIMISGGLGYSIYDAFTVGITDRFKVNYKVVRYSTDGFFLVISFIFHFFINIKCIGIGTILAFIFNALFFDFFKKNLQPRIEIK